MQHRLTRLRVEGMRTLEKIDLDLDGLRVLIGENGSGKSTVLEALEILRRTRGSNFFTEFNQIHGGIQAIRRHGAPAVSLRCTLEPIGAADSSTIVYQIAISERGVESELAKVRGGAESPLVLINRTGNDALLYDVARRSLSKSSLSPFQTAIAAVGQPGHPSLIDLQHALESVEVHVPLDVLPTWVANAHARPVGVRGAALIAPAERLERLGANLGSVYQVLRNDGSTADWETTMDWIRLGLGDWVESITVRADASGGNVGLWVKHAGLDLHLPARALSDGQLQFLGLVALCRLKSDASIIAFDEPEAHLHPHLQVRAAQFFQRLAERCPVLLATHSRRVLDALTDPAKAVRICSATGSPPSTSIETVDPAALESWMKDYDGLGYVLDAGLGRFVVSEGDPGETGS